MSEGKSPVNPPADSNPDVVKAKAKVNPQAVGAVLADAGATQAPPSPSDIEEKAKQEYEQNLAPSEALVHEKPLQGDEEDPKTHATEDPRSNAEKAEDGENLTN
jgi:hypothetical protein